MRTRLIAPLAIVLLVAAVLVAGLATGGDGGVRVQAGDLLSGTTTTQTPVTTSEATSTVPIMAPIPVVTTVATTVPVTEPTTVAPPPEPTAAPPAENVAAAEVPAAAPVPEAVVPDATQPAVRTGTVCTTDPDYCNPPATAAVPGWAQCPEYYQMALDVGWPESQMRTVMYVMNRESRCNPGATGSNVHGKHAQGLMQLLGWSCPPNGCYDPWSNLSKALDLWQSSGWRPWCLRGDRVTGSC